MTQATKMALLELLQKLWKDVARWINLFFMAVLVGWGLVVGLRIGLRGTGLTFGSTNTVTVTVPATATITTEHRTTSVP